MASYLQDGVGAFPQEQGFTPNYNFIMRTLEMRQTQYDQGFSQLKNTYNSVLNSELSRTNNKETRDQILANAQTALKDLPTVDLGNPKNVTAAQSVFKPFYENNNILNDMVFTKTAKGQISNGMALQNSSKEEDRKRYWSVGVQDLYNQIDEFKDASDEEALGMQSRRYVGKPQISEQILKMFNDGKLKRTIDKIDGQIKYTYENGEALQIPLTNLYLSLAENDPEAMEGFATYGRVNRTKFIKDNTANGMYATKEEAASAHDKSLVNDYVAVQNKGLKQSNDSLSILDARLKGWNEKLAAGTLSEQDQYKMAQDELEKEGLKKQIDQYNVNKQTANDKILRNPTGYLGNIYLHKSASDLATALSSVSGSSKIDSNPLYKDFVFPKELEVFKADQLIRLEREKSALNMQEEQQKAELKALYGDYGGDGSGSGGGKGTSLKELNIPQVQENIAASGVTTRAGELPDAYAQTLESKSETVNELSQTKASFIFEALDPNEIVNEKGETLNQNQMRNLLGNGDLLNQLYAKAVKKSNAYAESNPTKYSSLMNTQEKVSRLNELWVAYDKQMNLWTGEIIGNLSATETHPDKWEEVWETPNVMVTPGLSPGSNVGTSRKVTKLVPGKDEGWMYKHLQTKAGGLLGTKDVDAFVKGVQKDKKFDSKVKEQYEKNVAEFKNSHYVRNYMLNVLLPGTGAGFVEAAVKKLRGAPTLEQAKTQVTNNFKENFSGYRDKVIKKWNDRGLNVISQFAPIAGGGGTTARTLTFAGSNTVAGETADVITSDLLSKLPTLSGSNDMFVIEGPNAPKKGAGDGSPELKKLVQNGILSTEIMNAIKLGKTSDLKGYNITTSMVGGNDPNYHAYTLTFDADFISKMKGTENKAGLLGETADKLTNGITIFIKKDKDNTLASRKSTMGEIDVLVNTNPQGLLEREVTPGYGISIAKNPISGGYKIKTNYLAITPENLNGTSVEKEIIVPAGADLSTMYYQTISDLRSMYTQSQILKEKYVKSLPAQNKPTRASIDEIKAQMRNRQ